MLHTSFKLETSLKVIYCLNGFLEKKIVSILALVQILADVIQKAQANSIVLPLKLWFPYAPGWLCVDCMLDVCWLSVGSLLTMN